MSTQTELPFREYPSTLSKYSNSDQLQAHQYKTILQSKLENHDVTKKGINSNITINKRGDNKSNNYFWHYNQPSGTMFTDWTSAGVSNLNTDISISNMPLYGKIKDLALVLSNINNVRNNLQRYGKEYLTTTNLLNSIAFENGVSYASGSISPVRHNSPTHNGLDNIEHSNYIDSKNGDLYSHQIKQLDVDLPYTFANNTRTTWVYINPAYIIPNKKFEVLHLQLKYGTFDLDSIKTTGESCLTSNFNITPQGFNSPQDVLNDGCNYPPVSNPDYYNKGQEYKIKEGSGSNMYCSANTNYITMPKNHVYNNLDTSFQIMPGNNSITLGTIMTANLKNFIQNDLFEFNKQIIIMQVYFQYFNMIGNEDILTKLTRRYPEIFTKLKLKDDITKNNISMYQYYMNLSETDKYKFLFNYQKNKATENEINKEVKIFIENLSIFKLSGNDNNTLYKGSVLIKELNKLLNLPINNSIPIDNPGCFLLLPTMLSEDLFSVRENIPENFSGTIDEINKTFIKDYPNYTPIVNNSPNPNKPNECITSSNYKLNATNCAFRDNSEKWIQKEHPNFVPHMFNDPNNLNNDIYNLNNPFGGVNPYFSPTGF